MNPFGLTADQLEVRASAAKVARDLFEPHALEWDQGRVDFPIEYRRTLGDLGYLGVSLPEEYCGGGAPVLDALIIQEELVKVCRPAGFQVFESNTGPAQVVAQLGPETLKA